MDEDTWEEYGYAVSWYKSNSHDSDGKTIYLGELSVDICYNACMGFYGDWWNGDDDVDAARQAMQSAQSQIAGQMSSIPWNSTYLYLDDHSQKGGAIRYDSTSSTTIITDWAFTGNSLQWNQSSPSQLYNEIVLNSLPEGVIAVDIRIKGKTFKMKPGDSLTFAQLEAFFPWGDLPAPEMGTCSEDPWEEGDEPVEWPTLNQVVNDLYPWNKIGERIDLELTVTKVYTNE